MPQDTNSFDFRNTLTENIDQVVFAFRVESLEFIYLNPAFEQVFKLKRQSLSPNTVLQMVHEEDLEYVSEVYEELIASR